MTTQRSTKESVYRMCVLPWKIGIKRFSGLVYDWGKIEQTRFFFNKIGATPIPNVSWVTPFYRAL